MARLQKIRFLLVAFLVQALLLMPIQNVFAFGATDVPSASASDLTISSSEVGVGEMTEVRVQLLDRFSQPIVGHEVQLMTSLGSVSVFSTDHFTDSQGYAEFMLLSSSEGLAQLIAMDVTTGMVLSERAQIRFYENSSLFLSSESGPLAGFRIEGLESPVEVGETLSVTVTAVDAIGNTVSDYTGTVRFSSSDSQAKLPNDYSFRAEDAGKHSFGLGVQFYEIGNVDLRVTDLDQFTIYSETSVSVSLDSNYIASSSPASVSTSGSSSSTSDEDEGDFVLISPPSGTFSNDTIEVQGQAEYGYTAVIYLNDEERGRSAVEFEGNSFSYELKNLADGLYSIYVEIVALGEGEPGEEEILSVVERSETVELTIDTSAPELVEISFSDDELVAAELQGVVVLSESGLDEAYLVLDGELYELTEDTTPGKYIADIPLPELAGDYALDVLLVDVLGNEVEHRDAISFRIDSEENIEDSDIENSESSENVDSSNVSSEVSSDDFTAVAALMARSDEERVALSWEQADSPEPIAYYRVYYGPSEDALFAISDTLDSSTSWMVKNLAGEQIYYFSVAAIDILGNEGPASDAVLAVPLARTSPLAVNTDVSIDGDVPQGGFDPAMAQANAMPPSTPDSGAGMTAMLALSLFGAMGYALARKRVSILGN